MPFRIASFVFLGLIFTLSLGVAFMPANALRGVLNQVPNVDLLNTRGTVWSGQGQILLDNGFASGFAWQFQPGSLLRLSPSANWQLTDPANPLQGELAWEDGGLNIVASGQVNATALQPTLDQFDISISGIFELNNTRLRLTDRAEKLQIEALSESSVLWSGGMVSYVLGGQFEQLSLPPLIAQITSQGDQGLMIVVAKKDAVGTLFSLRLIDSGYVQVGVTRGFMRLMNYPWPGSQNDSDVVLEVEQPIF